VADGVFLPELAIRVRVSSVLLAEVIALVTRAVALSGVLGLAVARFAAPEAGRSRVPVFAVAALVPALGAHVISMLARTIVLRGH